MMLTSLPAALVLCLTTLTSPASANVDLPCINWNGPSANHQFYGSDGFSCAMGDIISWLIPRAVPSVIFIVIGLLFFLSCPCVFAFRYICGWCGGSKMRPGGSCCGGGREWDGMPEEDIMRSYNPSEVKVAKFTTVATSAIGGIAAILVFASLGQLNAGLFDIKEGFQSGVYFFDDITNSVESAARKSDGGSYIPSDVLDTLRSTSDKIRTNLVDGMDPVIDAGERYFVLAAYVTIAPLILMLLPALCAVLNIRSFIPATVSMCCFLFQFIFLLVGSILLLANNISARPLCNEVNAQIEREPGVFQWYFIPKCVDSAPFDTLKNEVDNAEVTAVTEACNEFSNFCSPSTTYNSSDAQLFYICQTSPCATLDDLRTIVDAMTPKAGVPPEFCSLPPSDCTLQQCRTACNDLDVKNATGTMLDALDAAEKMLAVYRQKIEPYLQCNTFVDKVLDVMAVPTCEFLPSAMDTMTAGFLMAGLGMIITVIVLFRGQKRFFSASVFGSAWEGVNATAPMLPGSAANMNSAAVVTYATPTSDKYNVEEMKPQWEGNFGTTVTTETVPAEPVKQAHDPVYDDL